ncbi:Imm1 family immunity protein [Kribbella sp. DT2]|uniref:Imm1 family immunity protein n=1 Tax=Kribbella sp. DT2 TaxID=3393427 RepID=UPI003CF609E9
MSFTARAYYQHGHDDNPVVITTAEDAQALVDVMLRQPVENSTAALYIAERPRHEIGVPDHELRFGILPNRKLGSIRYVNGLDAWYAVGAQDGPDPVSYQYMGHEELFPADSLVGLDVLVAVITDFLAAGAEYRPNGARWASWPDEALGQEEDDGFGDL